MTTDVEQVSTRIFTIPNLISAARISLIPVFASLFLTGDNDLAAVIVLGVIGSTDWVDGFVARRTGQVSVLGKLLDPIADRAAIIVALLAFAFRGTVPLPLIVVILVRDLIVTIAFPILEAKGVPRVPVNRVGKAATLLIYTAMAIAVGGEAFDDLQPWTGPISSTLLAIGAVLYWSAGFMYVRQIIRVRKSVAT